MNLIELKTGTHAEMRLIELDLNSEEIRPEKRMGAHVLPVFLCVLMHEFERKYARRRSMQPEKAEKRKLFWIYFLLIMKEKQLFFKKMQKKDLHFLRTWGII